MTYATTMIAGFAATNAAAGSNTTMTREELTKVAVKLGQESVNVARPMLAVTVVRAAFEGIIGEADVETVYDEYLSGRTKEQKKQALARGVDDGNGKGANVSKLRQLAKLAALPTVDAPDMIDRAKDIRDSLIGSDEKIEAPFDLFVKIARAQLAAPQDPLTDDQISALAIKAGPKEKDTLAKLVAAYKANYKLNKDLQMPGTQAAVDAIADALAELGEDVPAMTKEEKAAAKEALSTAAFMKKAAAMGFVMAPKAITLYGGTVTQA